MENKDGDDPWNIDASRQAVTRENTEAIISRCQRCQHHCRRFQSRPLDAMVLEGLKRIQLLPLLPVAIAATVTVVAIEALLTILGCWRLQGLNRKMSCKSLFGFPDHIKKSQSSFSAKENDRVSSPKKNEDKLAKARADTHKTS